MAYCTLEEAWGPNFFNESVKVDVPKTNPFLENSNADFTRSYNTPNNNNGPDNRYIKYNYDINPYDTNSDEKATDQKINISATLNAIDPSNMNLEKNNSSDANKENEIIKKTLKKTEAERDHYSKQNNIYKKYYKKCKKQMSLLTEKLNNMRKNNKLFFIGLIVSVIFNLLLLILLIALKR